jgi:hypothetical protein
VWKKPFHSPCCRRRCSCCFVCQCFGNPRFVCAICQNGFLVGRTTTKNENWWQSTMFGIPKGPWH